MKIYEVIRNSGPKTQHRKVNGKKTSQYSLGTIAVLALLFLFWLVKIVKQASLPEMDVRFNFLVSY